MTSLPDIRPYFFLHKSKEGFTVALQKGIEVYYVIIMDDQGELLKIPTHGQDKVQYLYDTLYKWLDYCPGDIPRKCILMKNHHDLQIALDQLPLSDQAILIPDLKNKEFEEFKRKMK